MRNFPGFFFALHPPALKPPAGTHGDLDGDCAGLSCFCCIHNRVMALLFSCLPSLLAVQGVKDQPGRKFCRLCPGWPGFSLINNLQSRRIHAHFSLLLANEYHPRDRVRCPFADGCTEDTQSLCGGYCYNPLPLRIQGIAKCAFSFAKCPLH